MDSITPCRYGAATVLLVAYDSTNIYQYPGGKRDSGVEDAAIVATHMMLAARDAGVDSCWLNRFDPDEAAKILYTMSRNTYGFEGVCLSENLDRLAGMDVELERPSLSQICVAVMKANSRIRL